MTNKFVSFLKKAGQIIANFGAAEAGLEPIFKAILPAKDGVYIDKLDTIMKSIIATDGMFEAAFPGQQTGPDKLKAAATLVAPLLASLDSLAGTHTVDSVAKQAAILKITSGFADYINALDGGNLPTAAAGAIPAPAAAISAVPAK